MSVGAKRGSEIIYEKYPVIIPACYATWVLHNPKTPLESIIIKLKKHLSDKTEFVGSKKTYTTYIKYQLIIYKRFLINKSNIHLGTVTILEKDASHLISNYNNKKLCRGFLMNKFANNYKLGDIFSTWQISNCYRHRTLKPKRRS